MYVSDRKHSIKTGRPGTRDAGAAVVSGRFVTEWGWGSLKLAAEKGEEKKLI